MKRWIALLLCVLLAMGLCSCGCHSTTTTSSDGGTTTTTTTLTTTTGIVAITDATGGVVTNASGAVETSVVTGTPTSAFVTVYTDTQGTTYTSYVTPTTTTTPTAPPVEQVINGITFPANGYSKDDRIKIGSVSLEGDVATIVVQNASKVWESEDGKSYFKYVCSDKDGNMLLGGTINFGYMAVSSNKTFTITLPEGTAKLALTEFEVEYWSKPVK